MGLTIDALIKEQGMLIQRYLAANCNPYTTVVIDSNGIRVMEDILDVPVEKVEESA